MSSPKTPKTPQRRRLSLKEKIKIIEDSKKPGFDKAKVMKEYGISRPTIINILKNQFDTLKAVDSGTMNDKSKSLKKSPLAELESQLYEWLCKTTRRGAVISGPLLKSKAKSLYDQIYGKKPNPPSFDQSEGWLDRFKLRYDLTGSYQCSDCDETLCVKCFKAHSRLKLTRTHTVTPL